MLLSYYWIECIFLSLSPSPPSLTPSSCTSCILLSNQFSQQTSTLRISAFPPVFFIMYPNITLMALSLPLLTSATALGLASMASLHKLSSSSSEIPARSSGLIKLLHRFAALQHFLQSALGNSDVNFLLIGKLYKRGKLGRGNPDVKYSFSSSVSILERWYRQSGWPHF